MNSLLQGQMEDNALLRDMAAAHPIQWRNPHRLSTPKAISKTGLREADVQEAERRLHRFAPYLAQVFPETALKDGIIESQLRPIPTMHAALRKRMGTHRHGTLLLKMDSHLPIAGSIKARGAFHEVLHLAEHLALEAGMLDPGQSYEVFTQPPLRTLLEGYSLAVGSTGNLGLAVGMMGSALGFRTTVHMSAQAKKWKKDLLRSRGVSIVEYDSHYGHAVAAGREAARQNPLCHFVDDEQSRQLFLGYGVGGLHLKEQLEDLGVIIGPERPLIVYLPCGVGGGPGGVAFGLKLAFGDHVHCYFAEPVQAPAVSLGLITGLDNAISATDIGLSGQTELDGLAVARPSALVCQTMRHLLDGAYTVEDRYMYALLALLYQTEDIRLEPSALAGFPGYGLSVRNQLGPEGAHPQAVHVVWATGGSLVPEQEWEAFNRLGQEVLGSG